MNCFLFLFFLAATCWAVCHFPSLPYDLPNLRQRVTTITQPATGWRFLRSGVADDHDTSSETRIYR